MRKDKKEKCIVFGCENYKGQGTFIGDICAPCYEAITTGKIGPSTSFLGDIRKMLISMNRLYLMNW